MNLSAAPDKIPLKWAATAASPYINPIPVGSQIGIKNGAASWTDGYPPNCFISLAAGGAGPEGGDTNGVLQQITAGLQYLQAGGLPLYDSTFATEIGGYADGAILKSATVRGFLWQSTADNNSTNPDAGGAGWLAVGTGGYQHLNVYQVIGGVQQVSVDGAGYTTSGAGSFPAPKSGVAEIEMWGAGGGAGGGNLTGALPGAGGGGEYARGRFTGITTSQSVTVGAPGAAGTSSATPTNGGAGGTTSVGSLMTAAGAGGGGAQSGAGAGVGGLGGQGGTGGQFRQLGNAASLGFPITGAYVGSEGGGCFSVSNNQYVVAASVGNGQPPYFPGGGGGAPVSGGTPQPGASGAVLIRY